MEGGRRWEEEGGRLVVRLSIRPKSRIGCFDFARLSYTCSDLSRRGADQSSTPLQRRRRETLTSTSASLSPLIGLRATPSSAPPSPPKDSGHNSQKSNVSSVLLTTCFHASSKSAGRITYLRARERDQDGFGRERGQKVRRTNRFLRTACNPAA
jgi:hypothetical protein